MKRLSLLLLAVYLTPTVRVCAEDEFRTSVVKIHVTQRYPDFAQEALSIDYGPIRRDGDRVLRQFANAYWIDEMDLRVPDMVERQDTRLG